MSGRCKFCGGEFVRLGAHTSCPPRELYERDLERKHQRLLFIEQQKAAERELERKHELAKLSTKNKGPTNEKQSQSTDEYQRYSTKEESNIFLHQMNMMINMLDLSACSHLNPYMIAKKIREDAKLHSMYCTEIKHNPQLKVEVKCVGGHLLIVQKIFPYPQNFQLFGYL